MIYILPSSDGQFYFNVVSKNGKVLATSETYKRKDSTMRAAYTLASLFSGDGGVQIFDKTI